jgi:hypothetical protein
MTCDCAIGSRSMGLYGPTTTSHDPSKNFAMAPPPSNSATTLNRAFSSQRRFQARIGVGKLAYATAEVPEGCRGAPLEAEG